MNSPARHQGLRSLLGATFVAISLLSTGLAEAATCPAAPPPAPILRPDQGAPMADLIAYGCSGRYARDLADDIGEARAFIDLRAATASKPAIVLDIDETSLSNWRQMLANDFRYIKTGACLIARGGTCSQEAWEARAAAAPIPAMADLVRAAQRRGVAVFFITGRADTAVKRATVTRNLKRAGYHRWSGLVMRAPDELSLSARDYKSARRAAIAAAGFTIIASIGDQWSDLDGGFAERTFKLVNPFYFIP